MNTTIADNHHEEEREMGDRANIVIQSGSERVYLYGHWFGCEMPAVAQCALRRNQRWDDPAYLARIVFCEMIKGREKEETGFGISASLTDNEYPICVFDVDQQIVTFEADPRKEWTNKPCVGKEFTFSEFTELNAAWEALNAA